MAKSKARIIISKLDLIAKWVADGLFEYQIFPKLGMSKTTWEKYKKEMPELQKVLDQSHIERYNKLVPELENALIKVALGYTEETAQEESCINETDKGTFTSIKKIKKVYPPDVGAIHICLKNFNRPVGTPWTDNPVGDDFHRKKMKLEQELAELKKNGF